MKNNIAFIVLSCDNYSDLWHIFIDLFEKNWPDCPFDKYFISNHKPIPDSSFKEIKIGDDISWSDGLIKALRILQDKYTHVLITLEDLPIIEKVNTDKLLAIIKEFEKENGNYLKFVRKPKPTKKFNSYFGLIEQGSLYRPTSVYALWNIKTFLYLLRKEENAWEFERYGAVRSDELSGFYVVYTDFFKILNTVVKGKWVPSELKKLKSISNNLNITRDIHTKQKAFMLKVNSVLFSSFTSFIPWKIRRKIVFKLKGL